MLEARDLCVRSPCAPPALDEVSVSAQSGEVVAVVGPNGSGKSTLLRVIAGLVRPQAGAVRLNGESLAALPAHRRAARGLIYTPESARTLAGLSVRENVLVGAWLNRNPHAVERDLERVLDLFPTLRDRQQSSADALSAGDRQILALGRALMSDPRVHLLDEPLTGLDARARRRVIDVIRTLRSTGVAVVVTEHDLPGVMAVASRAYVLRAGRVVFSGSAAAIEHAAPFNESYG
jgi:branched-chain amino acid transport system ATP-binding protein